MLNKVKILGLFLIMAFAAGCSSNDSEQQDDSPSVFRLFVNGEEQEVPVYAYKTEDNIVIDLWNHKMGFDTSGRFAYFNIDLQTGTVSQTSRFYSYREYSSNFFEFSLESIDTQKKRIKGTFSGYLYADPANLNSEQKHVSGSFDVRYYDLAPTITGIKNQAKIAGAEWKSNWQYFTRGPYGPTYTKIIQHNVDGGQYKIMLHYDMTTSPNLYTVGTINFTDSDITNKVQLAKFDPLTQTSVLYNCTGTLTVTQVERNIASGNYQFTAVNPNNPSDVIAVTDGSYKMVSSGY